MALRQASASFTVAGEVTTLTFTAIPAKTYGAAPFTVSASSASLGAITYSVTSGPATINSSTGLVTLTGAGTVVLGASQAANGNYAAATATVQLTVNPATPTLTSPRFPRRLMGLRHSRRARVLLRAGRHIFGDQRTGDYQQRYRTCHDHRSGNSRAGRQPGSDRELHNRDGHDKLHGEPGNADPELRGDSHRDLWHCPFTVSASSASSGAVTYSMTSGPATINSATGLLTITGVGTVVLGASQAATGNYTAATAGASFTVNPETPTLSFAAISTQTYGNPPFTASASSASSGAITYSVTSGPATINSSTGLVTIDRRGHGDAGCEPSGQRLTMRSATASIAFTVNPETPALAFTAIPAKTSAPLLSRRAPARRRAERLPIQ